MIQHTLREASRVKLLLVEDSGVNQKIASRMLKKLGYACDLANNGREAVEAVASTRYDLVFMDCQMPEMDGFEATRTIRERETGKPRLPIVAMTALTTQGDEQRCLEAGMDDYLCKPISLDALRQVLERFLRAEHEGQGTHETPGAPENTAAQICDLTRLREITGGDPDIEREIIEAYLKDAQACLADLGTAARRGDAEQLERLAHTLKGSSASIGAEPVRALAESLEKAGRENTMEPALEQSIRLKAAFRKLKAFLLSALQ
ncbi:MAG: response regulator [Nitrospiraceae bacterium]|nr:response regulator [Nitrospiraceae bacterium]